MKKLLSIMIIFMFIGSTSFAVSLDKINLKNKDPNIKEKILNKESFLKLAAVCRYKGQSCS